MWPPEAELLAAWRGLTADPDAATAFADLVFHPLVADLARRFPNADPAALGTAAGDTVLAFLANPAGYDPARCPLPGYLRYNAARDVLNLIDRERRHHRGRIPWAAVELDHPARNEGGDDLPGLDSPAVRAVIETFTAGERRVFDLMLDGERDTAAFAAALGLADRPAAEQAAEVYRIKDRVKQRLKRAGRVT